MIKHVSVSANYVTEIGEVKRGHLISDEVRNVTDPGPHGVGKRMPLHCRDRKPIGSRMTVELPHRPHAIDVAMMQPKDRIIRRHSRSHVTANITMDIIMR